MYTCQSMAKVIGEIARKNHLDLHRVGSHIKLENPPYMLLSIGVIGPNLVSVCHCRERNHNRMRGPEMVFLTGDHFSWIPVSFHNDYTRTYRVATIVSNGICLAYYETEQKEEAAFADLWAGSLIEQGFLDQRHDPVVVQARVGPYVFRDLAVVRHL